MPHPAVAFVVCALVSLGVLWRSAPPDVFRRRNALVAAGLLAVLLPLGQAWQRSSPGG